MNLSLRNRIAISFFIANLVVLILGFVVFFYLDRLNNNIEKITFKSNSVTLLTDEIRISAVSVLKVQRKILTKKAQPEDIERLIDLCDTFTDQLERLKLFYKEVEIRDIISRMMGYVESLKLTMGKATLFNRDSLGLTSIEDLADKILDAFSEFQDIQYFQSEERDKQIKKIIGETKRHMLITLIITFLGTILLGLIVPGKIALPFRKINDAIRELQDCNFDVSIYYNQDDEIGELSREMNRMIANFKKFEELRTDRINIEVRKFDALANMVRKNVLVANASGQLIYMNNSLYSLLQLQSDDVINKSMDNNLIPHSIREAYELAIKRRSKIENAEISITKKVDIAENESEESESEESSESYLIEKEEKVFQGFANVIPIRGKDSTLDYYIMILSKEVFT
jgi:CHASE3 domain sensor protein